MIEEALKTWEMFREGLVGELANIPEEKYDWRPSDGARTLREVALHIVAAGKGFIDELVADEANFMRLRSPQVQQSMIDALGDPKSKDEIVNLVRSSGTEGFARLREQAERLSTTAMANGQSRLTGVWFAASHEMYHRGQVAAYARAMGLVPAMTQRIEAMMKKQ